MHDIPGGGYWNILLLYILLPIPKSTNLTNLTNLNQPEPTRTSLNNLNQPEPTRTSLTNLNQPELTWTNPNQFNQPKQTQTNLFIMIDWVLSVDFIRLRIGSINRFLKVSLNCLKCLKLIGNVIENQQRV